MLINILIGLVILIFIGFFYYINSGPKLPPETNKVIAEVLAADTPELVKGEIGIAKSGGLEIWYEHIKPQKTTKGTVLLVMGHSSTAMLWTAKFYQPLVDAGYHVIRYDNRDVGMSTWIKNWDKKNPYTLEDMAKDGIAVLDAIGVAKAHVIGASMGGMIAQRMAISHSDRVLSLTSIMSSGYMMDPDIVPVPKWFAQNFIKLGLKYLTPPTEAGSIKFFFGVYTTLKGNGPYKLELKDAAELMLYETRKRRGFNKKAIVQQATAIEVSGSRLGEMGTIKMPVLIIHGKSDPLVIFAHAEKYAPLIPHAEKLFIDGMGHDLPTIYLDEIHEAIINTFEKVTNATFVV